MRDHDERHWYELYEGNECLIEAVPRCGVADFFKGTRSAFGECRGSEPCSYELYFVLSGILQLKVDGRLVSAPRGCALVVSPYQDVVGAGPAFSVEPCRICWAVVVPKNIGNGAGSSLSKGLKNISSSVFPVSNEISQSCVRLVDEHRLHYKNSAIVAQALIDIIIVDLLREYEKASHNKKQKTDVAAVRIARVLEWVDNFEGDTIKISQMAEVAGLSTSSFHRAFWRVIGVTPKDYITRKRIEIAREMLKKTDVSVIDIAMQCGFSTSQYFATVFRRYTGFTPSEYRKQVYRGRIN